MFAALLAWLADPSAAQSQARLVDGDTLLAACFDDDACGELALSLLTENMAEYGFVQQVDPIAVSALGGKGMGVVAEFRLDTVTLGPKNEIEKRVLIPPALPRFAIGYQYGSYTYDDPYPQLAVGITALPPIPVLGGTLAEVQLDLSAAAPLGTPFVWIGAEVGYGYGTLGIPLLGTATELREVEALAPFVPIRGGACDEIGTGCLDRFRQHAGSVRAGFSIEPIPALFAYVRAAGVGVSQQLDVAWDGSRWGLGGLQAQAQLGAGLRAGDHYQLALGSVIGSRPRTWSTTGANTMVKIVASTSFRFGDARYWERRDTGP